MITWYRRMFTLGVLWVLAGGWIMPPSAWAIKNRYSGASDMGLTSNVNATPAQARDNLNKITDAMVDIKNNGGGTIFFRPGTYCIDRPIRVLPDVNFEGLNGDGTHPDPSQVVLKNNYDSNDTGFSAGQAFYNAPVLFGGWDGAGEASDPTGMVTYRRISTGSPWPAKNDPVPRIRVLLDDYNQVNIGDEIKILSASNSVEYKYNDQGQIIRTLVRPDCMVKAVITSMSTNGGYWLYLDRSLPYDFGSAPSSQVKYQWGLNNVDQAHDPAIPKGQPCWNKVADQYKTDNPDYWTQSDTTNPTGYDKYLAMGQSSGAGDKWVKGWTTRNCTFKYLTFQSVSGTVTGGAGQCDSTFDHCNFQGKKCLYYNACQYTTFTNLNCVFWDEFAEFSYNSLNCTLDNVTATFNGGLKPSWDTFTDTMGMFNLNESTCGFTVNHLTIDASTRSVADNSNSMIRVCGRDNVFGNSGSGSITLSAPQMNFMLYVCPQNGDAIPPTNVQFHNVMVDMNGYAVTGSIISIAGGNLAGSNHITVDNTVFTNTAAPPSSNLNVSSDLIHDITLGPSLVMPGKLNVTKDMTNANYLVHYTGCSFAGYNTYPAIKNNGSSGTYKSSILWNP